jgi:hypothetical protein
MSRWYRRVHPKETPTHPIKKINDKILGINYFLEWLDG